MPRKDFSMQLQESLTNIESSLVHSINFEGIALNVLTDELQFLLNAGCITIDSPTESVTNILPEEKQALGDSTKDFPWHQDESNMADVQLISHKNFPSIGELYKGRIPLRLTLQEITAAYKFAFQLGRHQWEMTIYYNPSSMPVRFWNVPQFFKYATQALVLVSRAFLHPEALLHDQPKRLELTFPMSKYLESVLEALRMRLIQHLAKVNGDLGLFAQNPFFLQFFLITGSSLSENRIHSSRFFPLGDQREKLADRNVLRKIRENLESKHLPPPPDFAGFITETYTWDSSNAFVGYSFDTASSIYLEDWQNEPRAKGVHLSEDEQRDRLIATTIMQSLRSETPHLFIFPLFASRQVIAVVVINCPQKIPQSDRLPLIRCARDTGFLLSLALETDDLVNHLYQEKQKAARAWSYKHITQSIMHEERANCRKLQAFLANLRRKYPVDSDPILWPYIDDISFFVEDKLQLIDEFAHSSDPTYSISDSVIYPSDHSGPPPSTLWDISLDQVRESVSRIGRLVNVDEWLDSLNVSFGDRLRKLQKIPNLSIQIFRRILLNLIKNSLAVAKKRNMKNRTLNLFLDVVADDAREYLQIKAEDNCGGFEDSLMPDTITVDTWTNYLIAKEISQGMGFLILCKYADGTGGKVVKENVTRPEAGARVVVTIGLKN